MTRTCIVDIPGLSSRMMEHLNLSNVERWFNELINHSSAVIKPVLPAVTMPVQATYTTGVLPEAHGMIANGLATYRDPTLHPLLDLANHGEHRSRVSFWEQSNDLLNVPRIWQGDGRTVATLMLQSSIGAADIIETPKPQHTLDGKTISMCYSQPTSLHEKLRDELGEFPLHHYWGPMAGLPSTQWIINAAVRTWQWHTPDLQWVYIPQLDYDLQRLGPDDLNNVGMLGHIIELLAPLAQQVQSTGGRMIVLSEYGMTPVNRSVAPNVHLRQAGLLQTTESGEVDYAASDCFAMCDHQVAHVYCVDDQAQQQAMVVLQSLPEVADIYSGPQRQRVGLNCDRAGDIVAFTHSDAWFEYRWFDDFSTAPDFAWTVDIHRKPGYDPTEMFFDPTSKKTKPDQPQLVKGSHGCLPESQLDWPVILGADTQSELINATDVAELL